MAEYRYYLIPDAMTRAFPEQFEKQTPTVFFDNIADLKQRYLQLRELPYNNERTWNERARFPYARLVVGVDRQNPDGEVAVIQVRNGINYLCDDYRGPYADGSDAQIPQMAKTTAYLYPAGWLYMGTGGKGYAHYRMALRT